MQHLTVLTTVFTLCLMWILLFISIDHEKGLVPILPSSNDRMFREGHWQRSENNREDGDQVQTSESFHLSIADGGPKKTNTPSISPTRNNVRTNCPTKNPSNVPSTVKVTATPSSIPTFLNPTISPSLLPTSSSWKPSLEVVYFSPTLLPTQTVHHVTTRYPSTGSTSTISLLPTQSSFPKPSFSSFNPTIYPSILPSNRLTRPPTISSSHGGDRVVSKSVHTHLGDVNVQVFGIEKPGQIPVLILPDRNLNLIDEWFPLTTLLSENGYVCYILNFYKNRKISRSTAINIIHDSIQRNTLTSSKKAIIMGKSFGAILASMYTVMYPRDVMKLCLIAPLTSPAEMIAALRATNAPIFLGWAQDDHKADYAKFSRLWVESFQNGSAHGSRNHSTYFQFYSVGSGGHRVSAEYSDPILRFLQS